MVGLGEFEFVFTGKVFEKGFKGGVVDEFEAFVEIAEIEGGVEFDGLGLEGGIYRKGWR